MKVFCLAVICSLFSTGCALFRTPITPTVDEGTSAIGSAVINLTPNIVPFVAIVIVVLTLGVVICKVRA